MKEKGEKKKQLKNKVLKAKKWDGWGDPKLSLNWLMCAFNLKIRVSTFLAYPPKSMFSLIPDFLSKYNRKSEKKKKNNCL